MPEVRLDRVFNAGGAANLASAAVLERVFRAGAQGEAGAGAGSFRRLGRGLVLLRGGPAATGALVIVLVMRRAGVSNDGGTLGTSGRSGSGVACGAVAPMLLGVGDVRVVVVAPRSCRRWVMSCDGEVMPCRADVQSAMACMSVSAGVMVGFVIVLCWKTTVSLNLSLLVALIWQR